MVVMLGPRNPLPLVAHAASAAAAGGAAEDPRSSAAGSSAAGSEAAAAAAAQEKPTLWERVKEFFTAKKEREKIASMGMAAFLSYSCMSNLTYGIGMTIAWITFVQQKGVSPLAAGQWTPFLAFYAGMWAVNNFIRPARFAVAMAISPLFDRGLNWITARVGGDKKAGLAVCLFIMSVVMSSSLFSAIYLLGGLPDGLGPFPPLKRF